MVQTKTLWKRLLVMGGIAGVLAVALAMGNYSFSTAQPRGDAAAGKAF